MEDFTPDGEIDAKGIIEQLIGENEQLREKLAALKTSPITEALDGFVLVIKQTDPMHIYIWVCIIAVALTLLLQTIEVFIK